MKRLAVIKLRGNIGVSYKVKDTQLMIGLTRVNHCVIIDDRDTYKGMLQKIKDYITWGELTPEVLEKMLIKRGKVANDKEGKITDELVAKNTKYKTVKEFIEAYMKFEVELEDLNVKKVFRLSPPRKGYKCLKKQFGKHGDLGKRGDKINDLLVRMI